MPDETIVESADSLAEAREKARGRISPGFRLTDEVIFASGEPRATQGSGATLQEALGDARRKVPVGSKALAEREVRSPTERIIEVTSFAEDEVRAKSKPLCSPGEEIIAIRLLRRGGRGRFGLKRNPDTYAISLQTAAVAEVTYATTAQIRVTLHRILSREELLVAALKLLEEAFHHAHGFHVVAGLPGVKTPIGGANIALGMVSDTFNTIVDDARLLYPERSPLQQLQALTLGPPAGSGLEGLRSGSSFSVSDQFRAALAAIDSLLAAIPNPDS